VFVVSQGGETKSPRFTSDRLEFKIFDPRKSSSPVHSTFVDRGAKTME